MLFSKIVRCVFLASAVFAGECSAFQDAMDTQVILEENPKKPTGLVHKLPQTTEQLYFHDKGPFSSINQAVVKHLPFIPRVKKLKMYSHFSTRALVDVVRHDEALARGLADLKQQTRGFSDDARNNFLIRELQDLAQSHIFYVLGDFRDAEHPNLQDPSSAWHVFLQFEDGSRLVPSKILEMDFDAETRRVFGSDWYAISALKTPYCITFPLSEGQEKMSCRLIFSAPDLEDAVEWPPLAIDVQD